MTVRPKRELSEATREKLRAAARSQADDARARKALREAVGAPGPGTEARLRQERYEDHRRRRLPDMLVAKARQIIALEREAARLGVKFTDEELKVLYQAVLAGDRIAMMRLKERVR